MFKASDAHLLVSLYANPIKLLGFGVDETEPRATVRLEFMQIDSWQCICLSDSDSTPGGWLDRSICCILTDPERRKKARGSY